MLYQSIDPTNNQLLQTYPTQTIHELEPKLVLAKEAAKAWRKLTFAERAGYISSLATLLEQQTDELSRLATLEMGKPLQEAAKEISKSASTLRYFAAKAEDMLKSMQVADSAVKHRIVYEPLGLIFGIFPWNFPYWQVIRFAAPTLMAGNVIIVKHAPNVPQCALKLANLFQAAGFPEGVFTNVFLDNENSAKLIAHPAVNGVSLTGSEVAGSAVAAQAGKYIKPSVLELGGSDALLVLEDADLDLAIKTGVQSRFINSGQACNAAKRFIVTEKNAEVFTHKLIAAVKNYRCVDPKQEQGIGPLARKDLLEKLEAQVAETINLGGKILHGGKRHGTEGNYFEPTILTNIPQDSPAYKEELFGPVISLFVVKDEEEAIQLANDTRFGLDASVFSANQKHAEEVAMQLETAQVFINSLTRSMPELPFGGSKASGYGRELSVFGIHEFVQTKTIVLE